MAQTAVRCTGEVKWFNVKKGFGFIIHEKGDVFVHYSQISADGFKQLQEGDHVEYTLQQGPKGLSAEDVVVVDS